MWRRQGGAGRARRGAARAPDQAQLEAAARAVIECAPGPIVALGRDRTVAVWNPAAERMFGWSAAEVLGLEPPIIPRELRAEHNAVLERVAAGGQISLATRRTSKEGEMLDLRLDIASLTDASGERLGWIMLAHPSDGDGAVRHYMAERARVVRRLGDVVADMNAELDLEAVLDRIAASLRELTRADAGGFVLIEGERLRLVSMDGLPADLRGRTADLPSSLVGELMRSGNTVLMRTGESGRFDDLIWSALPGLHTITLSLSHVAGRPYGALYALYSGRKVGHVDLELLELLAGHASVALSNATAFGEVVRQRAHERAVIDGSADGIAVLDRQGLVRQWNPAAHALTGVSASHAVGKLPPFPLPEPGATLTCRLGNERWIDVLCTVLEGRDEQVIDFRDVTAAKELEEAKDLFLATTSHELRTPITVVQGFASTLANRWDKLIDKDRRMAVRTIAERAESLARLVDQLLLGSRAGADGLTVSSEPFDLARLLTDAATVFGPLSARHAVVAEVPDGLPEAQGDAGATDSIVSQLLENAFKYSPDGGTVTIAAADLPGTGEVEVTVRDEGIGIAAADVERVFERFVQGDAGDRRRFGGIGLGLYIVRQLARAQGGDVTAAPAPGRGTVMRLTLPRASAAADAEPAAVVAGETRADGSGTQGAAADAKPTVDSATGPAEADGALGPSGASDPAGTAAGQVDAPEQPAGVEAAEGGARKSGDGAGVAGYGAPAAADGEADEPAETSSSSSETAEGDEAPEPADSTESDAKPRANVLRLPPVLAKLPRPRTTSDRGAGRKD